MHERRGYLDGQKQFFDVTRRVATEIRHAQLIFQRVNSKENVRVRLSKVVDQSIEVFRLATTLNQLQREQSKVGMRRNAAL